MAVNRTNADALPRRERIRMKPVFQTRIGPVNGNCMAACLASIFEVAINDVPDLGAVMEEDGDEWWNTLDRFVRQYGLTMLLVKQLQTGQLKGWHMIWGASPRGIPHSVVGCNGKIIHDPHPEGGGLIEDPIKYEYVCFVALDPAKTRKD